MRIFKNFEEMLSELSREIKHNGVEYQTKTVQDKKVDGMEDFRTKELMGYSFMIKNPDISEAIKLRNLSIDWIMDEYAERVGGVELNPGEAWKHRKGVWDEFLHDGKFSYTYPERIGSQVQEVIDHLIENPASRQAIINIYDRTKDHKNRGGKQRVPCSMFYQFMLRDNKLSVLYVMRSVDFGEHFPYDLVMATMIMQEIAERISAEPGNLIFFSSSLHTFYKDNKEIF